MLPETVPKIEIRSESVQERKSTERSPAENESEREERETGEENKD